MDPAKTNTYDKYEMDGLFAEVWFGLEVNKIKSFISHIQSFRHSTASISIYFEN